MLHAGHTDSVEAVALSSVLPVAATASIDGKVLIWDNATLSVRGTCEHPEVQLHAAAHMLHLHSALQVVYAFHPLSTAPQFIYIGNTRL